MEISFNTPALLFPAISLLLLAYTNRFLALANLVRKLHDDYKGGERTQTLLRQIHSLRLRLRLVRYMQGLGVFSFLCSVISMYLIYNDLHRVAGAVFATGLLALLVSLVVSLLEITQSTKALELELSDIEELSAGNIFSDIFKKEE